MLWIKVLQTGTTCALKKLFHVFFAYVTDVDECRENPNICQHGRCTNTAGGYRCDCSQGYVPSQDGKVCVG